MYSRIGGCDSQHPRYFCKYTPYSLPVIPCEDRRLDPQYHPDTPPFRGVQTHTYPQQGGPRIQLQVEWDGAPVNGPGVITLLIGVITYNYNPFLTGRGGGGATLKVWLGDFGRLWTFQGKLHPFSEHEHIDFKRKCWKEGWRGWLLVCRRGVCLNT